MNVSPLCGDYLKFRLYRSLLPPYGEAKSISETIFGAWIETHGSKRMGLTFTIHSWIHQRLTCNKEGIRRPSFSECFWWICFCTPWAITQIHLQFIMRGLTLVPVCQTDQSPCWWDAPVFTGLAFRPTQSGGWKERALGFLGHRRLLLSVINPSLCPRASMAAAMLLLHDASASRCLKAMTTTEY